MLATPNTNYVQGIPAITGYSSQRNQYLYFIQDTSKNLIKIGISVNPEHRLKCLQTANGSQLILLKAFRANYALEKEVHKRFKDIRVSGEWFKVTPILLHFIDISG